MLYDNEETLETVIENFKEQPAVLILTQYVPGEWSVRSHSHPYELKDHQTLEFRIELKPREKVTLQLDYVRQNIRG